MTLSALEQLLKEAMGLDASSIGRSAIERAARERVSACGVADLDAYWAYLHASPTELQELIDAVVVPETWFFRDREAYDALATLLRENQLRPSSPEVFRILSLPCSSGEEPYSIVMTMLDCGLPSDRFTVDAIDISTRALALASRGLYGQNSFRGTHLAFRDVYFQRESSFWRLSERVRKAVQFRRGNMLAPDFLQGEAIYDIIFCRNLLIYFDRATQDGCVEVLRRLLKPDGSLFVGSAETGLLLNHGFVSARIPNAFAFRAHRAMTPGTQPGLSTRKPIATTIDTKTVVSRTNPALAPPQVRYAKPPPPQKDAETNSIAAAGRLADQGHLGEAAQVCEAHIRTHGISAQSCQLMGLIRHATGNTVEAIEHFRRALYLDPNHYEAMTHLALLLEKQGNISEAHALQRRLQRLASQAEH